MGTQDWPSRLAERVRIEQRVETADEFGGHGVAWETLTTVWAEVRPMGTQAREKLQAGKLLATAGYRVRMRLRDDVTPKARLVWKGHVLLIHSLHENEGILDILTYEEGL